MEEAIEACSCPREPGERLTVPLCPVKERVGNSSVLFVDYRPNFNCRQASGFGNGHLCGCAKRLHLYQAYGI